MTEGGRFATVNEGELKRLIEEKDAKNTRRAMETAVKTFRSYLKEKDESEDFEKMSAADLDKLLARFFVEVRTINGEHYKKTSLFALRHGLNRFLSMHSDMDIIHGDDFSHSKNVFQAAAKELKRQGKGGIDHHPPIEEEDTRKMYAYFDLDNNVKLQEKVFVDMMLYFGRRGRENIHLLKISDFAAKQDGDGQLYIYMKKDELTKNHQMDANTADGRMYAVPSKYDPMCPVKTFMKYKQHLNSKCDRLFQRPSKKENALSWYDNMALGHNTIGSMMKNISTKAGLSRTYSNHSLRATLVHLLDSKGNFASRHIMTVTGHRAESSLKSYTGYTEPSMKRKMSDAISSTLRVETESKKPKSDASSPDVSNMDLSAVSFEPLSSSQLDNLLNDLHTDEIENDAFDEILKNLDVEKCTSNSQNRNLNINIAKTFENKIPFPCFNFSSCSNITVNYNFSK
ncbi:uncharacterized protein KIAA1958-like [Argopecten irradians]|uniref:uncharacterized protein KIAA1958-like n=1 Tax=Argopecten irradians TaxID=31199 RepID=UPI0037169861